MSLINAGLKGRGEDDEEEEDKNLEDKETQRPSGSSSQDQNCCNEFSLFSNEPFALGLNFRGGVHEEDGS